MKASDILNIYNKVAPALGYRANAWITLLALCEAGDKGLSASDLAGHNAVRKDGVATTLRRWHRADLCTVETRPARCNRGGKNCNVYVATPKLHAFLRVEKEAAQ